MIQLDKDQYLPRQKELTQPETESHTATERSSHCRGEVDVTSRQGSSISVAKCAEATTAMT